MSIGAGPAEASTSSGRALQEADPCGASPCQNGGQCTPSGGGMGGGHRRLQHYTCTCVTARPTALSFRVVFLGTPSTSSSVSAQGFTGHDCAVVQLCADLQARTQALNEECCNEPGEDCSSGRPTTCNAGCARVLLPFFDDCGEALGPGAAQFDDVY